MCLRVLFGCLLFVFVVCYYLRFVVFVYVCGLCRRCCSLFVVVLILYVGDVVVVASLCYCVVIDLFVVCASCSFFV